MNRDFTHLNTLTVPQMLRHYARKYMSHYSKMFFPVQNNFPKERWKKLGFCYN